MAAVMNAPDLALPALVLRDTALDTNIRRMAGWCEQNGFLLAPHGKTTMCPQIFARQMSAGACAMTVATVPQARICLDNGIRRILIANQVAGEANIRALAAAMNRHPEAEFCCLVDSVEGVHQLSEGLKRAATQHPLNVLIEIGKPGWRTGARSFAQALQIFDALPGCASQLTFRGFEAFEGLAKTPVEAQEFLAVVADIAERITADSSADDLIFSAGGSSYLGPVKRIFQQLNRRWKCVLRSGCYVTHDHGIYARQQASALETDPTLPRFEPALELWACVQSLPDPGIAILTFGKRNCAYDVTLPVPIDLAGGTITAINDQHAYLSYPANVQLRVGSPLRLGISHPCTAFDKWQEIPLVDDNY
ncbi:MAG TPA: hypothetical protein VGL72_26910, partial [Bryobacteraceae bacterium]